MIDLNHVLAYAVCSDRLKSKLVEKIQQDTWKAYSEIPKLFCFISLHGLRNPDSMYGSYRSIRVSDLLNRRFRVTHYDHEVGIEWMDAVHDERTYTTVRYPYVGE